METLIYSSAVAEGNHMKLITSIISLTLIINSSLVAVGETGLIGGVSLNISLLDILRTVHTYKWWRLSFRFGSP